MKPIPAIPEVSENEYVKKMGTDTKSIPRNQMEKVPGSERLWVRRTSGQPFLDTL